ncbi:MAG: class I SAM-dependent methyltransferase [Candidatus Eisenbacteria bacterium]|nr:class I SAM-dependent methyltransferase [Candidatus Eisenbacteria bacterium]
MPEWYRESFDELYSDLYSHRDDEESVRVVELLGRFVRLPGSAVLDVCCGEGRYLKALSRAGAKAHGLDLSETLLKRRDGTVGVFPDACVRGDMRSLPFRDGTFDMCINMFTSMGYFGKNEDELGVLREMRRVLKPRGYCFVDHGNLAWLKRHLEPHTVRRRPRFTTVETRAFLNDGRTVEKSVRVYPAHVPARGLSVLEPLRTYRERVRFFTRSELGDCMARVGFDVLRVMGDYAGSAFDECLSPRLIVLARRRRVAAGRLE